MRPPSPRTLLLVAIAVSVGSMVGGLLLAGAWNDGEDGDLAATVVTDRRVAPGQGWLAEHFEQAWQAARDDAFATREDLSGAPGDAAGTADEQAAGPDTGSDPGAGATTASGPGVGRSDGTTGEPAGDADTTGTATPTTAAVAPEPTPSTATTARTAAPPAPSGPSGDAACEAELLAAANGARAQAGVAPLAGHGGLRGLAREWSSHMAATGRMAHNPNPGPGISAAFGAWNKIGENVGYAPAVATIHSAWMGSGPHRANIVEHRHTHVGVGCVRSGGNYWATQVFAGNS